MEVITEKRCITCDVPQPLTEYYVHSGMADGRLNKCKDCIRAAVKNREHRLRQDQAWVQRERKRCREKYRRLEYGNRPSNPTTARKKTRNYRRRYPEKYRAHNVCQRLRPELGVLDTQDMHHWSYHPQHTKDVILLSKEAHVAAHLHLRYDAKAMMYRTDAGELLDTNLKHYRYLQTILNL